MPAAPHRRTGRLLAVLAVGTALSVTPAPTSAAPRAPGGAPVEVPHTSADLARLGARLDAAIAASAEATRAVQRAAQRTLLIRRQLDELAEQVDAAQAELDQQVRAVYVAGAAPQVQRWLEGLTPTELRVARGSTARTLRVRSDAIRAVERAQAALRRLEESSADDRSELRARALASQAKQDEARQLLVAAQQAWAADAARLAQLAAASALLDQQSAAVSFAAAPAVTARGRAAAASEAPIIAALESVPLGQVPPGFHQTGRLVNGIASWYGPGFVGHPTSTGAPYDPERLTAAMLLVPLGTVVRVTGPDGRAVCVLVNDHGPYVDGRVIDLSRAAARAIGVGLSQVSVEVLEHD